MSKNVIPAFRISDFNFSKGNKFLGLGRISLNFIDRKARLCEEPNKLLFTNKSCGEAISLGCIPIRLPPRNPINFLVELYSIKKVIQELFSGKF